MNQTHFIKKIDTFIKKHILIQPGTRIIVGLSGGPDSIFLLNFLADKQKEYGISLVAAHLDHQWRPDSDKDAKFCADACEQLGVPLSTQQLSELAFTKKFNGSKEEFARHARRHFFGQVQTAHNADAIALAHHAQDQQETFFIRLMRGTTLSGLTSMHAKHGYYIRPLLETNKQDILNYLDQHNIAYLTDPTNTSQEFLRNRIRLQVMPALKNCDQRWDNNFLRTLTHLQEIETYLTTLTQKTFVTIAHKQDDIWELSVDKFLLLEPVLRYRVLLHWLIVHKIPFTPTQKFLDEILRFLQQPGSKTHHLHKQWSLVKKKNRIFIDHSHPSL